MRVHYDRFVAAWLGSCLAVLLVVGALNVAVDPYMFFDVPRISGFNARKPASVRHERSMKPYDVLRWQPKALLLGSSRVNYGFDARDPLWPQQLRPVYNLSFLYGGPYMAYRHLQHVISQQPVSLVVVGLDFEYFLQQDPGPLDRLEYEARLAVTSAGGANPDRRGQFALDMLRTYSLTAVLDSARTVAANVRGESYDLIQGNLIRDAGEGRARTAAGSLPYFASSELLFARTFQQYAGTKQFDPSGIQHLRSILELCTSEGIAVAFVINPVHADLLEIIDRIGLWPVLEDWKRDIAALTAEYPGADGRCAFTLWDFNGYDPMSTESVTADRQLSRWYIEPSHFNRELGGEMLARIFGSGNPRFGVLLTAENVEQHLAAIRERRQQYRERQRAAVRRVHELYDAVVEGLQSK